MRLLTDTNLVGGALAQQLKNLDCAGATPPSWFHELLEKRNKMLKEEQNKVSKLEYKLSILEEQSKEEKKSLVSRIKELESAAICQPKPSDYSVVDRQNVPTQRLPGKSSLFNSRRDSNQDVIDLAESPIWDGKLSGISPTMIEDKGGDFEIIYGSDEDVDTMLNTGMKVLGHKTTNQDTVSRGAGDRRKAGVDVLVRAGPSKLGMISAPGPSFIRKENRANTGMDKDAKYIRSGPDGRGGLTKIYRHPLKRAHFGWNNSLEKNKKMVTGLCQKDADISSFFKKA